MPRWCARRIAGVVWDRHEHVCRLTTGVVVLEAGMTCNLAIGATI